MAEAHERYGSNDEGENSQVYPALASAPRGLFGICVAGTSGRTYAVGDAEAEFSIMSVSKPFVFALVCQALGPEQVREKLGVNSTGLPFNSLEAVERSPDGRTNPMVNSGCDRRDEPRARRDAPTRGGRPSTTGSRASPAASCRSTSEVYRSASATNQHNRTIASVLAGFDRIYCDPAEAIDLYTRQCSLNVSARDLALMGATLADGGVHPLTRERVVDADVCRYTLTVMTTAGLYETSGDWLYDVGLPGKSGIGGGIVTVSPGKGGLGTFAPPLDAAGNSVKGQLAARFLSGRLGLDLFASRPDE